MSEATLYRKRLDRALDAIPMMRKEVAEACEVRASTVSTWVHGDGAETLPSGPAALALYRTLAGHGVDLHWLLTGEGTLWRAPDDSAQRLLEVRRIVNR